ncbi:ISxac2 transposase [Xanthomonas citri pv. aurantifolii str. ICPB 10535]|nr:ISxac2 transposase [Xanthomonas citri pv. aurantifolii str. ICPB 10535]
MVRPSQRREMAQSAVTSGRTNIRHACQAFAVSETCFRYQAKASEQNARIADWLVRLTTAHRDWGFGLCYLYLRNVKGFGWNHKRVYRIYRELELNLRIKPKKRLVRERPEPLGGAGGHQPGLVDGLHARPVGRGPQLPAVQCARRLQSRGAGDRGGSVAAVSPCDPIAGADHRVARQARRDPLRQRP